VGGKMLRRNALKNLLITVANNKEKTKEPVDGEGVQVPGGRNYS